MSVPSLRGHCAMCQSIVEVILLVSSSTIHEDLHILPAGCQDMDGITRWMQVVEKLNLAQGWMQNREGMEKQLNAIAILRYLRRSCINRKPDKKEAPLCSLCQSIPTSAFTPGHPWPAVWANY